MRRTTVFKLIIVFFFLGLFMVSAEFAFRLKGDYKTYQEEIGKPYLSPYHVIEKSWIHTYTSGEVDSYKREEFDFEIRTNNEGLRDVKHPVEKPDGEFRILHLGDSFSEGVGAPFDSTWGRALHKNLNEKYGNTRVIAGSISGSDPFFAWQLYQLRLYKYEPDLVIFSVNNTDIYDVMLKGGMERFQPDGTIKYNDAPKMEKYYSKSHLLRFILREFFKTDYTLMTLDKKDRAADRACRQIANLVKEFHRQGEKEGFKVMLMFHPTKEDIEYMQYGLYFDQLTMRYLAGEPVETVDVMDYFIDITGMTPDHVPDYFWPIDRHNNPAGYEQFAFAIQKKIEEIGIIEQSGNMNSPVMMPDTVSGG